MDYLLVAVGGAIGSVGRYWCSEVAARLFGESFPWGTLIVNVVGSAVIGFVFALSATQGRFWVPPSVRLFVMVGICGGYTTFSAFSLQTLNLMRDAEWNWAFANAGMSLVFCMIAVWLGFAAGSAISD